MNGRHYRRPTCVTGGTTREYRVKRHKNASLFLFTLTACLLLALAAAGVLAVDFGGRAVREGAEPTAAFAVSEAGQAKLSFLGREYRADVSFLLSADRFLVKTGTHLSRLTPACLRLAVAGLPTVGRKIEQGSRALLFLIHKTRMALLGNLPQ